MIYLINDNPAKSGKVKRWIYLPHAFAAFLLLVFLLAVYSNSFYGDWHYDDFANIVNNRHIQIKDYSWENIKHCIYGLEQKNPSRPLSFLSFSGNYYFFGLDVFSYHVVNFILHYLAACFLFLFLLQTLQLPLIREKYTGIAYPLALSATLFWALNPVQVTSVAYIVQRMAVMAGLFCIVSMFFYLQARTAESSIRSGIFYGLCAVAGVAAVLSKENAAMLPVSIFIYDLFLIAGFNKENIKKYLKLAFGPVLFIVIAGFIYTDISAIPEDYKIRDFTMLQRLLTEPRVIIFYLSLLFFPINSRLTFLYDIDVSVSLLQPWTTLPAILFILTATVFAFYLARKRPLIAFCIIFYFLNHLIEGSVFPLELIYEHRNYLPAMLLFVPPAKFLCKISSIYLNKKTGMIIFACVMAILLAVMGSITYQRNSIIAADFLLWTDNIEKSPRLSRPHTNLGRIYYNKNMNREALSEYEKAVALNNFGAPQALAIQNYNLGLLYFKEGKDDLALNYFHESANVLPDFLQNTIHMARIKIRRNNIAEARLILAEKLEKYPGNAELMALYKQLPPAEGKGD